MREGREVGAACPEKGFNSFAPLLSTQPTQPACASARCPHAERVTWVAEGGKRAVARVAPAPQICSLLLSPDSTTHRSPRCSRLMRDMAAVISSRSMEASMVGCGRVWCGVVCWRAVMTRETTTQRRGKRKRKFQLPSVQAYALLFCVSFTTGGEGAPGDAPANGGCRGSSAGGGGRSPARRKCPTDGIRQ